MFKFSEKSLKNLSTVDPRLRQLANEVLKISPYDIAITEGYRDRMRQKELYMDGKSKCDGEKILSKHQLGKAIDIMVYVNGKGTWTEYFYNIVADVFKKKAKEMKINITWGGDWKNFKDCPHFEIND